jgi:cytochrome c oxidase accessory protein FixG
MNDSPTAPTVEKIDVTAVNKKETRSLYKKRVKVHPKRVNGAFRRLKWWIMGITLGVYYVTPWLRWDRGPGAPDQAVLIDFPARRFYFFFIEIWPQEVYYITGLLILAALGLFLVTTVVGRAWCGYSCPQTVWTDLFVWVERWIEGDRAARIRLDKAPLGPAKIAKRLTKFAVWMVIALLTGGAWVFYYADAPTLAVSLVTLEAPAVAYWTVAILTFTTFTMGGLMREQVCTYMCPWPRIQAAMMDEESLTVTYRLDRGEPRAPYRKHDSWEGRGDCVDCNACVAACPTGIDIRDGQQLECITCALCIDACDDIMTRIGRPRGLIDYDSVANSRRRIAGQDARIKLLRPRVLVYFGIALAVALVMLTALLNRADLDINVLRDRNPLFTRLSDGSIRNGFAFKILNKSRAQRTLTLTLEGLEGARLRVVGSEDMGKSATHYFTVKPDRLQSFRLLVTVPKGALADAAADIRFILTEINSGTEATYDSIFRGPEQ